MREAQASEELSERGLRGPEERARVREVEVKEEQVRISQAREPREKLPKARPRLFIPLKCVTTPRLSEALTPRLHVVPHTSVRLGIVSTKIPQSFPLTPTLRTLKRLPRDIRVRVHEPFKIVELKCPSPRLKLRPRVDRSIRPLLEPLTLADLGLYIPSLALWRRPVKGPKVLPAPLLKCEGLCIPKIGLISLPGAGKATSQEIPQVSKVPLKREIEDTSAQIMAKESSRTYEEEIFIPPLLEGLSSTIAKPISRPVCVVLPKREGDSFVHSVAIICREIYRIVKGGKPIPRWISKKLKEEIERYLKAEDMIFIVDDSNCEFLPNFSEIRSCRELLEKVDLDVVFDRLREFFSQDFGFIIFHVNERWAGQFANLLKEKVGAFADIVEIQAPDWQPQAKAILAKVCWGFVEKEGETFDEMFGYCEKEFFNELSKAKEDVELTHYVEWDESASPEHESMKVVVVRCLARELGAKDKHEVVEMLEGGEVKTEYEVDGGRADIYVPSQQRFVEVETFYGTGDPITKLDKETLRKYLPKYEGTTCRVDVVLLTGIQALLYARRLVELAEVYRKRHGLKVDFYLSDIRKRKLVPLKRVFRMLREAAAPSRPVMLTEDDVEKLRAEFSKALRERGMDPEAEEYKRLFKIMVVRSRSYQENLRWMREEIESLKK